MHDPPTQPAGFGPRRHVTGLRKRQQPGRRAPWLSQWGDVRVFSCSSVKHLHGCGLIALALRQETTHLLSALVLSGPALRGLEVLRASMGRDDRGEVSELLGLQG